eukprot:907754-Amphidinium_carterae.1
MLPGLCAHNLLNLVSLGVPSAIANQIFEPVDVWLAHGRAPPNIISASNAPCPVLARGLDKQRRPSSLRRAHLLVASADSVGANLSSLDRATPHNGTCNLRKRNEWQSDY